MDTMPAGGDSIPRITGCQIDFQFEKNNKEHRTDEISTKRLIVRRGQVFNIKVTFIDGFNPKEADLKLVFETGPDPITANETKLEVRFTKSINVKRWSAMISSSTSSELCLAISPSPRAKIGYHRFRLLHDYKQDVKYELGSFVILFNPWCSEDDVFLNSDPQRDEYVMNENGIIYVGSSNYIHNISWNFGQFEDDILDICLKLLDKTPKYLKAPNKALKKRGSPVYVARTVSAMVNCNDDTGIILGKWSTPYSGGVHPGKWNGSTAILRKWNDSDCQAVRYGQCWVFAAVTCTVLRCLGIPTRVVTNFDSAHDTDANLSIDEYYHVEGYNTGESDDSIWNFHVWDESWMARTDLRVGYDGWQAVDATPQEKSEGTFCCGPASVTGIKEGETDLNYDIPFVFAEVNARCVDWLVFEGGKKMMLDVDNSRVGHYVSTKKCGCNEREDVTSNYKYPDGSIQEAEIFKKANRILDTPTLNKTLSMSLVPDLPSYNGKPVSVTVVVSNKTSEQKVYDLNFWAKKRKYNGVSDMQCFKKHKQEITIAPNEVKKIPLKMNYKEYGMFPDMYNLMKLISLVTDVSTESYASAITDIALINPPLIIKIMTNSIVKGAEVVVEISFQNIFPQTLKDCVLTLEGAGLINGEKEIKVPNVAVNELAKMKQSFVPYKSGLKKLLVDFNCDKLQSVKGSLDITVQEK